MGPCRCADFAAAPQSLPPYAMPLLLRAAAPAPLAVRSAPALIWRSSRRATSPRVRAGLCHGPPWLACPSTPRVRVAISTAAWLSRSRRTIHINSEPAQPLPPRTAAPSPGQICFVPWPASSLCRVR
ncbi:hypothetical protein ZWY2020_035885 [Hordeum vulgare]|nr:hypothetical protein ZWY2020_035885 [Hordeum vulgare]